ncbi:hypothetical protein V1509DRAFT_78341 [Lipomyces kononenkoae]
MFGKVVNIINTRAQAYKAKIIRDHCQIGKECTRRMWLFNRVLRLVLFGIIVGVILKLWFPHSSIGYLIRDRLARNGSAVTAGAVPTAPSSLRKRNIWRWIGNAAAGGLIIAAAATVDAAWAPILCAAVGPGCWALAIVVTVATATGLAVG